MPGKIVLTMGLNAIQTERMKKSFDAITEEMHNCRISFVPFPQKSSWLMVDMLDGMSIDTALKIVRIIEKHKKYRIRVSVEMLYQAHQYHWQAKQLIKVLLNLKTKGDVRLLAKHFYTMRLTTTRNKKCPLPTHQEVLDAYRVSFNI